MIKLTQKDIEIAYKKTKYTLLHDRSLVISRAILNFEKHFNKNIGKVLKRIQCVLNGDEIKRKEKSCLKYPKGIKRKQDAQKEDEIHFFSNSPQHHQENIETIEFREVINASLSMHIFSTLWVMQIGDYLDKKLSENVYCSRLFRKNEKKELDNFSPKLFKPYFNDYRNWRDQCFTKIRELHQITSVVAITLDISEFFQSTKLDFFLEDSFYKNLGLDLLFHEKPELRKFHEIFINCLKQKGDHLQIGLTCAPILANSILHEWDRLVEEIHPIYYGRYMDDILLVLPSFPNLDSGTKILDFLLEKKILRLCDEVLGCENSNIALALNNNNFVLKKTKQKFFYFDKNSDLSMLDAIEAEIDEISSEWNFIPDIASSSSSLYKKAIGLYGDQNDFNNALRKIESSTLKRLGLSLLISNALALNEYVVPKNWINQRKKIYDLTMNHLLIPENFFRNYDFVFRLFGLMISSCDFDIAEKFLENMDNLINSWRPINSKDKQDFQKYHKNKMTEVLIASLNQRQSYNKEKLEKLIKHIDIKYTSKQIEKDNIRFFLHDLCLKPFASEVLSIIRNKSECRTLHKCTVMVLDYFCKNFIEYDNHVFSPMLYLKKTFTPLEISELMQEKYNKKEDSEIAITKTMKILCNIKYKAQNKNQGVITVRNKKQEKLDILKIAIANFKIPNIYWEQSIRNNPDRSLKRYNQLEEIINNAIKVKPHYLVLPELAIPEDWAQKISKKLLENGISLITGIEYIHDGAKLYNPVKMFLISDDLDYPYMQAFRQDKISPAHEEASSIQNTCGYTVEAHSSYKEKSIYRHGDFFFSVLICNELTDINNRACFRGDIDALFVIEWNKDIKSFNAYVESTALDIHCYVIQANNGYYGDSRIRAPYKEDYKRDIVRITGGANQDTLVVGEINIGELRKFQSNYITPNDTFKPVPTGFKMSKTRKKWNTLKNVDTKTKNKKEAQ